MKRQGAVLIMSPNLRKLALIAHVTASVGWIGAIAGFLALAIAGLTSENAQSVRAAYLAMDLTGWYVIVPFSIASLLIGFVMSLGTNWGLFKHYWVVAKLLINLFASILLLLHMQPTTFLAVTVAMTNLSATDHRELRIQLIGDAVAAIAVLLVATALAVYKPRGLTPYGRSKEGKVATTPRWVFVSGIIVAVLVLIFIILHLTGRGLGGHLGH